MAGGKDQPLLLLTSPLGDDTLPVQQGTLHAIRLAAVERLSMPFEITLTVVSSERSIDPNELLYQQVCVTVRRDHGLDRYFNGIVCKMDAIGFAQRGRWHYRLVVVPRLWFLTQTTDCRIFQQKTSVEILQTLFAEHRVDAVEFRIYGTQPVREYTTQFNESDLDFAHRLLQESGYFYFFEHSPAAHTLIITDGNQAFKPLERPTHWVVHNGNNVDIFDQWCESLRTTYGSVRLQDYDPVKPSTPVLGQQATTLTTAGASERDVFRWPAMTPENAIAGDRARFRMEAAEAAASLREGHGFDPLLCPGYRFSLGRDPFTGAENVDHAIHGTKHMAVDETWLAGTSPPEYDCHFTCFLQTTTWREELSIPRPAMTGIFSAIVLGDDGEEIHADQLARIKVRPLFDYRKDTVANMAIWIRILNAWAGNTWGWQHLPRVGTEVGISFMNGDPDNPVVVGCFYNQEMLPVFPIPQHQTRQGFRSRSTLHGSSSEFSELSFDDLKGQELVYLHAQKDHTVEVENDQSVTIGHDRTVVTTHDDSLTSKTGNISISATTGTVTITAAQSITLRVDGSTITITPESITVVCPGLVTVGPAEAVNIGPAEAINIGPAASGVAIDSAGPVVIGAPELISPPPDLPV